MNDPSRDLAPRVSPASPDHSSLHPVPPSLLPFEGVCIDGSGQGGESGPDPGAREKITCGPEKTVTPATVPRPTDHSSEPPLNVIECEGRLETQAPPPPPLHNIDTIGC